MRRLRREGGLDAGPGPPLLDGSPLEDLDVEDQRGVRRDLAVGKVSVNVAVTEMIGDDQLALAAYAHSENTDLPIGNQLIKPELGRGVRPRASEPASVGEPMTTVPRTDQTKPDVPNTRWYSPSVSCTCPNGAKRHPFFIRSIPKFAGFVNGGNAKGIMCDCVKPSPHPISSFV